MAHASGDEDLAYCVELFAGLAAELELGLSIEDEAWLGAEGDIEEADQYLTFRGWTATDILQQARAFVRAQWPAIAAVADRLLLDETLDSSEIEIILDAVDGTLDVDLTMALRQYRWGRISSLDHSRCSHQDETANQKANELPTTYRQWSPQTEGEIEKNALKMGPVNMRQYWLTLVPSNPPFRTNVRFNQLRRRTNSTSIEVMRAAARCDRRALLSSKVHLHAQVD